MGQEKHRFQSEAAELLTMMIHSVYSNKEIFLRELVSNASDALDKRRIEVLSDADKYSADYKPEIRLVRDPAAKTLQIADNGIGMSRDEIISYIGTIAKSGTKEFLAASKDAAQDGEKQGELIGQFGVGFYSAFMVSNKVELVSRRLGSSEAWRFISEGNGEYTLEEAERDECGTTITMYLKEPVEGEKDYADEWQLRDIVRRYSDFIAYPIVMNSDKSDDKEHKEEFTVINSQKAIWNRPEEEVKDEEYRDFYRHLTHDWQEPLTRIIINAEGPIDFRGLLFIPQQAELDMLMNPMSGGLSLYIKRVFIMNDCKELIPEYLRFVRGVIDSEDLPLNISREILQEDQRVRVIRRSTLRKVFTSLRKLLVNEREKYEKFWGAFGKILKEGVVQDSEHGKTILGIALFHSSTEKEHSWTTLDAYKSRMKPDQKGIYYLAGRDLLALAASPKLEMFNEKGYEVLLLTDPVDEVIMAQTGEYDGTKFLNVSTGSVQAANDEEQQEADKLLTKLSGEFAPLKDVIMKALGDHLSDAKMSVRMKNSPACLVGNEDSVTLQMEQMMRAMGRDVPPIKRIMEVNPSNPLVIRLMELAKEHDERVEDFVSVLYDQAVIMDGGTVADPAAFARRLAAIMSAALQEENVSGD